MENKIQILLIDDHPLLRKGLSQLIALDKQFEVVGEAGSGEEGVLSAAKLAPDLIILDLNMRGMDGIETLKSLRAGGVSARVLIYTVSDNDEDIVNAIRSGADGYLLKDMEPENLLVQLKQAAMGKMVVSGSMAEALASALRTKPELGKPGIKVLTPREQQILKLIVKGLSNKMIGNKLGIAEGTVKVHVKSLLKKLMLRTRVEAAVWGSQQGL